MVEAVGRRCVPTLANASEQRLVEAAGRRSFAPGCISEETTNVAKEFEPFSPVNTNPMMVHDFGFYCRRIIELPRRYLSPRVPSSPLESSPVLEIFWRRKLALCQAH